MEQVNEKKGRGTSGPFPEKPNYCCELRTRLCFTPYVK
jgi:hypothetical protein